MTKPLQIVVGNSECQILDFTKDHYKLLKKALSYPADPKARFFSGSFVTDITLLTKKGTFPTGLLPYARRLLIDKKVNHAIIDRRKSPTRPSASFKLSTKVIPHKWQEDASERALEAYRGVISASTGSGKSIAMAVLISKLQMKTLIVVPNLGLREQLRSTFKKIFGTLKNIDIYNVDSPDLQKATDYDCLIVDECHHVAASTYRKLNKKCWGGIFYRFFYTATPFRSRSEETMLMESVAGQVIYTLDYPTAVSNGFIVPVEAYYLDIPKTNVSGNSWASVYSEMIVNNEVRNDIIASLLKNLNKAGKSTLCLVREIKHGENLQDLTGFTFAKGENEDNKQVIDDFNNRKFNVLIGTNGVMAEGIDSKPCEYVIITGLGKSKPAFMQSVGRTVRTYPGKEVGVVIIFRDSSHKFGLNHFKNQLKTLLDEYGCIPVKLELG